MTIPSNLPPLAHDPQGFIAGHWVNVTTHPPLPVVNPATGETLGHVPDMADAETTAAIDAAAQAMAQPPTIAQRAAWLAGIDRLLHENRDALARIITLEQGKPLGEAGVEVDYAAGFFRYYATHLDALAPRRLAERPRGCDWTVHHRPAGVAGLITPWNFPLAMLAKKLSAAIGAGCATVIKPSELTPLTSVALFRLLETLDLPPGLVNLVTGRPAPIGEVLCRHPAVRVLSFTGSTATGKRLLALAAAHVKRLALELGGNAPFIVFGDANIPVAIDALLANKFRAAGQTCVCANRIYVEKPVAEKFLAALAPRLAALRVGNGLEPGIDIGPLINRTAFAKVDRHVRDALGRGAHRVVGHHPAAPAHDWGAFYPATLLSGIKPDMVLCQEETFGPVVAVSEFEGEDQGVSLGNSTPYGLAAYVFTGEVARAQRVAARLHFGHVGLNTGTGPTPEAPFGGMKESGFGREGGVEGLAEFCEVQTLAQA